MEPLTPQRMTAGGIIKAGPGRLKGLYLEYGSANAGAVLYDNTTSSGTVLAQATANTNQRSTWIKFSPAWVDFDNLFLALSGTGAVAIVYYR